MAEQQSQGTVIQVDSVPDRSVALKHIRKRGHWDPLLSMIAEGRWHWCTNVTNCCSTGTMPERIWHAYIMGTSCRTNRCGMRISRISVTIVEDSRKGLGMNTPWFSFGAVFVIKAALPPRRSNRNIPIINKIFRLIIYPVRFS